jgi:hypothetical protein
MKTLNDEVAIEEFEFFMPPKKGEGAHGIGILPGREVTLVQAFDRPTKVEKIESEQEFEDVVIKSIAIGITEQVVQEMPLEILATKAPHARLALDTAMMGQAIKITLKNQGEVIRIVCLKVTGIRTKEATRLNIPGYAELSDPCAPEGHS